MLFVIIIVYCNRKTSCFSIPICYTYFFSIYMRNIHIYRRTLCSICYRGGWSSCSVSFGGGNKCRILKN